jgi:hypothetical protein
MASPTKDGTLELVLFTVFLTLIGWIIYTSF